MLGTSIVAVIRCFSTARSTAPGSNRGSTTIAPPAISVGTKNAAPAWLRGVHIRNRGRAGHSHSASCTSVMAVIDAAVPTTPFGLPVVPPV